VPVPLVVLLFFLVLLLLLLWHGRLGRGRRRRRHREERSLVRFGVADQCCDIMVGEQRVGEDLGAREATAYWCQKPDLGVSFAIIVNTYGRDSIPWQE
jgi:hypothetical protein